MLSKLPAEIQEAIILECALIRPSLVATLAQTSRSLRELVCQPIDGHLWRTIFLALFDDPRANESIDYEREIGDCWVDWKFEAQRRFRAQIHMDRATIVELSAFDKVIDDDVADAMWEVACTGPPENVSVFKNGPWLSECFRSAITPPVKTQAHAKLHIVASFLPVTTSISLPPVPLSSTKTRLASRAYTYDLRNYTEDNLWGPWLAGSHGAVNWIHLWHLMDVLRHNAHERGCADLPSKGIDTFRAYSMPRCSPIDEGPRKEWNDWAGVEGIWLRAVSFMDYRDLHQFNFSGTKADGTYSTSVFQDPNFAEAFRLIKAYFAIVKVEEKGPSAYPHRPTIHFVGDAGLPTHDPSSHHHITHGTVSMTKHGHIRWSFSTRVGGHQWASEGVQLGNVQSRAGVIGVWSSAVHDESDPAGPFWLWKSPEEKTGARVPNMHLYHFVPNAPQT